MDNGPSIVDLPIKDGDFPVRYVKLPEANQTPSCVILGSIAT